jgi:hypothetical protein
VNEAGTLTMSGKELNRLEVLGRVVERRLTQAQAAEQLGLGVRQVERLCLQLGSKALAVWSRRSVDEPATGSWLTI